VHLRATSNVGLAAGGKLPEPKLSEKANQALQNSSVKDVINKYSLPPLFLEQVGYRTDAMSWGGLQV
jgi:hypothetical protein